MIRIAIDGPGGAGKSTIAKAIANKLGIDYVDTGAMYRGLAYKIVERQIDLEDKEALKALLDETEIDFSKGNILVDGKVVNEEIRKSEISEMASTCSAIGLVREKMVGLQKDMALKKSVIMDGRDIGTNVMVQAEYKFYLTANPEVRGKRRFDELVQKGDNPEFQQVLQAIIKRDESDMTRKLNPLRKAKDAIEVDTSEMSIEEVIKYIMKEVEHHGKDKAL